MTDPDTYPYAQFENLVTAVLRHLTSEVSTEQHAHKDAEAEYARDLVHRAAADLTAALEPRVFTADCQLCDYVEALDDEALAQNRATYHVYDQHPDTWVALAGDRAPHYPRR